MKKLDKKVNISVFIARTVLGLFIYGGFIAVVVMPEAIYSDPLIKILLIVLGSIVVLPVLIFNFILPFFIYKIHGYELKDEELLIHRGVLYRRTTFVPIKRIQHIQKFVGPVQILFNLSTVQVFTAGSADSIVGLNTIVADQLIDEINEKLNKHLIEEEKNE